MYGGKLVETGATRPLFREPHHPYTRALISSIPTFDSEVALTKIAGHPHSPVDLPTGCVFHPRCPRAMPVCSVVVPQAQTMDQQRTVACHLYGVPEGASDAAVD
jgi:oligopeptide/dipeptide ABC transporter ATP-binding protein